MNPRIKILAIAILSIGMLFILGVPLTRMLQKPLKDLDSRIADTRDKLIKIRKEKKEFFGHEKQVKTSAERTFGTQPDTASAKSGEMISRLILQSGLQEGDFSRSPFGPRKLTMGIDTVEIGWSVQGEGKLDDVIDLLFLLQESPYLHRVENLNLQDGDAPGRVRVNFRFLTLVVKPSPGVDLSELEHKYSLYSDERKGYAMISQRDLLRPYIKRPPPPPPPGTPRNQQAPGAPNSLTPPGPESFRIVSLSEWAGQSEVHLRDMVNQKTLRFKPGENLAGGMIVQVDYRPMPLPGNEEKKSFSRVILKIGTEYWAIEQGQTLAQKYRLNPEQLPSELAAALK